MSLKEHAFNVPVTSALQPIAWQFNFFSHSAVFRETYQHVKRLYLMLDKELSYSKFSLPRAFLSRVTFINFIKHRLAAGEAIATLKRMQNESLCVPCQGMAFLRLQNATVKNSYFAERRVKRWQQMNEIN